MNRQETKQPFLQKNIFRIADLNRDELTPSVRSYADNLQEQIIKAFKEKGILSMEQMEEAAFDSRFSLAEMEKMNDLMDKLNNILKSGEIPEITNMESIENRLKEEFVPILNEWAEIYGNIDQQENLKKLGWSFVNDKIKSISEIPCEVLLKDKHFCQRVLEYIYEIFPNKNRFMAGLFLSTFYNKILENLPYKLRNYVYQELDLEKINTVWYLGLFMNGGQIDIKGKAGKMTGAYMQSGVIKLEDSSEYLGYKMLGGEIFARHANDYAGLYMAGGKLKIKRAETNLGYGMKKGFIQADTAEHGVGREMQNGTIIVGIAEISLGYEMKGGKIIAGKCKDHVGIGMKQGRITVSYAGNETGTRMTGGKIVIIKQAGDSLGKEMKGGEIIAKKAIDSLGAFMQGGYIQIEEAEDLLGRDMTDGKIIVKRARNHMGIAMNGGEIIAQEAGDKTGSLMTKGSITVKKSGNDLGISMKGGKIEAEITGNNAGSLMKDGEIYIAESYESLGARKGGKIYFKGKEIT